MRDRFPTPRDAEYREALRDRGCATRLEYLESLAEEHALDQEAVFTIAELMGENEDFDGLVTFLEDQAGHEAFHPGVDA